MIKLGPGGTAGLGYESGLSEISRLNLDALEVEYTYGVRMKNDEAKKIGEIAKNLNIDLSVHAPYYVNLNSSEKEKIQASKKRILDSCERAHHMGAKYVVFHAGFYQKSSKEETYENIKKNMIELQKTIKEKKWKIKLAPETTGKASQFGDLDELLKLRKETGCHLCVDFAHIKARNVGNIDYDDVMKKISKIGHVHAHFAGIVWTAKGERHHEATKAKDVKELFKYLKKYKIDVTIIDESPDPIEDAVKMKKLL